MLDEAIVAYCRADVADIGGFARSEFVSAERGRFHMRAYPASDCGNNLGTVHGGFLLALADMAGTGAADTLGRENATLSLNANFLRPARVDDEYLDVVGTVLHGGRRTVVSEVAVTRPDGETVLKATCTVAVFDSLIVDVQASEGGPSAQ